MSVEFTLYNTYLGGDFSVYFLRLNEWLENLLSVYLPGTVVLHVQYNLVNRYQQGRGPIRVDENLGYKENVGKIKKNTFFHSHFYVLLPFLTQSRLH